MKIKHTLNEGTTISKIFLDINTGKYYRVKGNSFVEIQNPNATFNQEDPNNDQYDPEQDEEDDDDEEEDDDDEEEDDQEPIVIKRDTFEFDDEEEEEDEENDPDDPDETHRPGVIVHNKADGKDYVWNKKLKKYIRFK